MDAYIAIRGSNNISELSDVPPEQMKLVAKKMRPVQDQRVQKTKWVVLRWPTPSMAQLAGMSTEAFEDFLLRRLHARLPQAAAGHEGAQDAHGQDGSRCRSKAPAPTCVSASRGSAGDHLRRRSQHSRRRSLQLPGEGFRARARDASTLRRFTRASASTTSGSTFATARSSKQRATRPRKLNEILDSDRGRALHRRVFARF